MKTFRVPLLLATSAIVAVASACGAGSVTETGGTTPADTTRPPTTVQRATIAVTVSVDPADSSVASTAGLSLSGLTVRLTRDAPGFTPLTATTDANGVARFPALLDGIYQASVDRALTAAEVARLQPSDREASIFAGGATAVLSPPANTATTVSLIAARRGSLVISEVFAFNNPLTTNFGYNWGTYIELYNNADTTVYLDGVVIFKTPLVLHGGWPEYPCDQFNLAQRLDSTSIYASSTIHQFPGSGREFPLAPGRAAVLATDAMDHNAAAPGMGQLDLSRADFEQIGSDADIDNPFSANMLRVTAGTGLLGRGFTYVNSNVAHGIALPAARAALVAAPIVNTFGTPPLVGTIGEAYRIPRSLVLDVVGLLYSPDEPGYGISEGVTCSPFLAPVFERSPAPLVNTRRSIAISRKTLTRATDGREILQRTRTAARDFEYATPLRRSLKRQ